jgi:hypothetical protein
MKESKEKQETSIAISSIRLRVGVILLFLWWLPFWLLQPFFVILFSIQSPEAQYKMFIGILITQTIVGFAGLFVVGKQVAVIMRHKSYRQIFPTVWHALIHGEIE